MDVDKQTWKIHNQDKYYISDLLAKFSLYSSKLQNIQFLVLGDNCHLIQSVKFLEFIYSPPLQTSPLMFEWLLLPSH